MAYKYWVGNGGNWSDTAHWSLSSGGSGGASVPTIEDSVIFDANSITIEDQTVIAYMYPNFYCNGLDFSNIAVSFTFSLSSQSLKIAGGILRLSSLLVLTFIYSGESILFVADSCEFYCNGYTGRLQLGAYFDSSAGTVKPSVVCYDSITSYDFRLLLDECDFTTDVIITSETCRIYCRELTVLNLLASVITCSESFHLVVYPTTAVNSSASITVGSIADFSCYNAELLEAPITFFNHLIFDPSVGVCTYAELFFRFDNSVYNSYAGKVYGNTIQVLPGFTNFYFNSYSNFSDVYLHLNDLSVCGSLEQQLSWEIEQSSRSITRILIDSGEINTEYTTLKGICASGAVPTGLSNVCVGGIASAFSTSSGYDPADAFDNVHDTDWEGVGLPNWLQYDLGAGASKTVERYMLIPWDQYRYCCTKWNFEGSNDGLSWNVLDSQDNTSSIGGFVIDNPVSYRFYRINIFEAGESGSPDLTEFRMFEGSEYKDGATFYALTSNGCIDGGGNTGWIFDPTPPVPTKYWVGNGGNWSDTAHWSLSSGGTGGAALPTIDDDVYFDNSSFTLSDQTVFVDIDIDVKSFAFDFSNDQPDIPYPGRVDNITIDFNEHAINTYEGIYLHSHWSSVFNLSNSTVTGSFVLLYECPIPTDNLILSNTNFVLDMIIASSPYFQIICNSEEQSEQQSNCVFNIATFRVIFEDRCNPYIGLDNDLHIDNFIVVDETIYDDPLLYGFPPAPSHEIYLNFDGSSYTYKKVSVNFDHINVGWDVDSTKFIKKGVYSYTQYKEISYDFPYSFTINNLIKERSVSTLDQILGEWVLATKVENNPQIHEYSVSSEGVFTFNEANAVDGALLDYFYIDNDSSPDSFVIFNLDEQFQYNTHYRNSAWDGGNLNLILNESQNLNGIIKILKPGEYLLNSVDINHSESQISGNLYLNDFYSEGTGGENNIITGNGTEWNIISSSPIITISNTTLYDSQATGGATFNALTSNGNVDGGGNTGWNFGSPSPSNKSVFLRFNDIRIAKGTRLLPESILLTLNLSSIITELTENTIKIYINEISNVISAPTTIEEFNALVLSEPILYQTNLQRKNLTSMHIDITELIKKVINLENWSSGNSIMLVLKNDDPFFLKFFDFSENADKVAMISKTDVTTTSNIETGIITSSNTVLVSEETRTVVIPSGYVIGDYVFIVGNHIIGKAPNPVPSADYYFIHNFETAVDQPDYVWDMEYPDDYELYYEDTVLDANAKFGNYACDVTNNSIVGMYYEPYDTTNGFWPPLTYEFWFNFTPIDGWGYLEIWIFGWKPEGGWNYAMYQTWCQVGKGYYAPHTPYSYMEDWIFGTYDELISEDQYPIPFAFSTYNHCAIVVLTDRIKLFINGTLHKEYVSTNPNGFNVMYSDFYIDNEKGSKLLVDALSITKGEKYTENFTPPTEPPGV